MPKVTVMELSRLTGKTRENIMGWIDGLEKEKGTGNSWTYDSKDALARIYLRRTDKESSGAEKNEYIDQQEANRILAVRRGEQIELEMQVTAKRRIPIELCEEINEAVFSNVAGMLKSLSGKEVTDESVQDMLTELRGIAEGLKKWSH